MVCCYSCHCETTWWIYFYNISDHNLKFPLNSISLHVCTVYIGYNNLTGSIHSELLNYTNYTDFDVYGNGLSNLTAVDGEVVCSAEEEEEGVGEHYCNCGDDCLLKLTPNVCACEEAEACCATYIEQFTECLICDDESSGILENPDFYVEAHFKTCFNISTVIRADFIEYGTDIQCDEVKIAVAADGCICKGGDGDALD